MMHDLDDVLHAELCQDEEIRWKGSPALKPTIQARLPWMLFGLVAAFLPITFDTPGKADLYKITIYFVFALVFLRISYGAFIDILATKRTLFAVTDQRAISVRVLGHTHVCSWFAEKMNILEYKFSSNGHGSVYFRKDEVKGIDSNGFQKSGFIGILEVEKAVEALKALRSA